MSSIFSKSHIAFGGMVNYKKWCSNGLPPRELHAAVRGSVVRAEKPRNISGSRAPFGTCLASTFFPTYHRI